MKIKDRKSISKRFKYTAKGHLKYKSSNLRHLLTKKSSKRKRKLIKKKILKKNIFKSIYLSIYNK